MKRFFYALFQILISIGFSFAGEETLILIDASEVKAKNPLRSVCSSVYPFQISAERPSVSVVHISNSQNSVGLYMEDNTLKMRCAVGYNINPDQLLIQRYQEGDSLAQLTKEEKIHTNIDILGCGLIENLGHTVSEKVEKFSIFFEDKFTIKNCVFSSKKPIYFYSTENNPIYAISIEPNVKAGNHSFFIDGVLDFSAPKKNIYSDLNHKYFLIIGGIIKVYFNANKIK